MSDVAELNIFKCLDFLRDNAKRYAQAKANRVYAEEFRKSKKALLMTEAEKCGAKASATQERDAYASEDYIDHLQALRDAVEIEETLRWQMIAAQARIEAWRSLESTRRIEAKVL